VPNEYIRHMGRCDHPYKFPMNEPEIDNLLSSHPVYFVGTSGWTYDHWKGRFYTPDLPKKGWFDYYAREFQAVEVNATFYRTFKDQTYNNWRERAPQGFGYVLKAPRLITHRKYLVDVKDEIRAFYHSCSLLQDKFEMILLQVAPNMPYDLNRLQAALSAFPDPGRVAVEFRRPEWLTSETMSLLGNVGATICNVDSPQQRITDNLTSNRAYLRLHGRNRWYMYDYSDDELREIADLARNLADKGANRVYIFFNNDFEAYAPANAQALQGMLKG
jgi:uncharacterized protein YecE (DUF72 family)